jgi:ATP-dependent DNA helicase RecQ
MTPDPTAAVRILREIFGYEEFRGAQREIIEHVVGGGDALVLMPTGGGKSLCYQIPALVRAGLGVVVSPLIALMQDQVAALQQAGVRAAALHSGIDPAQARRIEQQARSGELDLLYMAPERLLTARALELLEASPLALFAIDEAHCVSQWGHDFRPEYIELAVLARRFPSVPRIALTATADGSTRAEIIERLQLGRARLFVSSFDRPNIRYRIGERVQAREQLLNFLREEHPGESGIVYCLARRSVEQTAAFLERHGIAALPYHAGLDAATREAHQGRFVQGDAIVMVATIAFGMGIDKPDVRFVAHLDLPKSIESYYQETGRAGRDGLPADAWMVYGLADVVQQRRLIEQSEAGATHRRLAQRKLEALLGLCEASTCRRARLLEYFGEASTACGNCDNCLAPPPQWDATQAAQKLMSCIVRCSSASGFGFGAQHVIDVLRGERTAKVSQFGHERLSTFGIGRELDAPAWRALLRQLIMRGLVEVDVQHFNVLRLAPASRAVLRGEESLTLRRPALERPRPSRRRASASARGSTHTDAALTTLYERLREWRRAVAREQHIPAYTVFHDRTLLAIAEHRPRSPEERASIVGIGAAKLARYGASLLELVSGAQAA